MKITNVVKALEKAGLKVEKNLHHDHRDGTFTYKFVCKSNNDRAEWFEQNHDKGEVDGVYICGIKQHDDLMTDYFPGSFYHTIKSIVNVMAA